MLYYVDLPSTFYLLSNRDLQLLGLPLITLVLVEVEGIVQVEPMLKFAYLMTFTRHVDTRSHSQTLSGPVSWWRSDSFVFRVRSRTDRRTKFRYVFNHEDGENSVQRRPQRLQTRRRRTALE